MSKVKKKKTANKFDTDVVSNSVVSKYGDVVSTGTEVLESINSLEVIGVSPALRHCSRRRLARRFCCCNDRRSKVWQNDYSITLCS